MPDTVFLSDRIEVSRPIPAPPAAIFDILRSPAGRVAIDASGMLQHLRASRRRKWAIRSSSTWIESPSMTFRWASTT